MSVFTVSEDVYGITLNDAETLSAYLVAGQEPALIETGTANGVSHILDGMEAVGIDPADLRHAVIGHYHLDHAGGAPGLLDVAPNVTFYLHEEMADWITDPDRLDDLISSSATALGDQFAEMGAPERPLPDDRVTLIGDDGLRIDAGSTTLEIVHTPGHTPDHVSILLPERDVLFANEAIGRYFPRSDDFHPPITVPSFDIEATRRSIDRLEATDPDLVALSHYGFREDSGALFDTARRRLDTFCDRVPSLYDECDEDLSATVELVRHQLTGLDDGYPERVAAVQADVCTRGVLRAVGRV